MLARAKISTLEPTKKASDAAEMEEQISVNTKKKNFPASSWNPGRARQYLMLVEFYYK